MHHFVRDSYYPVRGLVKKSTFKKFLCYALVLPFGRVPYFL